MIETFAYARAGLLGNPSDGYYGKTISFILKNFRARVLLYPSARLEIKSGAADIPIWESLDELRAQTRWRGYYGGIRILKALIMRFTDYCDEKGIELHDRNFTLEYESNIPLRLGMGGSSAIIIAALRALSQYFGVELSKPEQANLALETETRYLGVGAGLQDRVIQVYEGLVFMDFARELMQKQGHGQYEALNPSLLPHVYVAYRRSLSEGTEVFHNNIRSRFEEGDPLVVNAMQRWAAIAAEGRQALLEHDHAAFDKLIDENFDLRASIYKLGEGNLEMVRTARGVGATAKFAGSGGAIVGTVRDPEHFAKLSEAMAKIDVAVMTPKM
ncbi:MAG: GHMP kinase [Bryobacterales bacterium]|nr:GHMP kinase [Acidobacteriota bacterium]MCB9383483.1 GHMP kinase [Bryobacterales bacterium]